MKVPRVGSLRILRPVGMDKFDNRVNQWDGYIVEVVQPFGCPKNGALGHCYVKSRTNEFIGLVLLASLQPLDDETRKAIRQEKRLGEDSE